MSSVPRKMFAAKVLLAASRNPYCSAKNYLPPNLSILSKLKSYRTTSSPPNIPLYFYSTSSSPKGQPENEPTRESEVAKMQDAFANDLENVSQENGEYYKVVQKNYQETNVPGANTDRKYSGLSQMQKEIISSNEFSLSDPNIIPKTGSSSSFAGLSSSITQISLGKAKIRQQNQVFLSQVDPLNIPADLEIRFDSQKQIRIIGAMVKKEGTGEKFEEEKEDKSQEKKIMKIMADTVEHKQMSQFMEQEFNGLKAKVHYGKKRYRRLDLLLGLLIILILGPTVTTLNDYYWCLDSIRQVQKERMKEITNLKQNCFVKVLFNNHDFNRQI